MAVSPWFPASAGTGIPAKTWVTGKLYTAAFFPSASSSRLKLMLSKQNSFSAVLSVFKWKKRTSCWCKTSNLVFLTVDQQHQLFICFEKTHESVPKHHPCWQHCNFTKVCYFFLFCENKENHNQSCVLFKKVLITYHLKCPSPVSMLSDNDTWLL